MHATGSKQAARSETFYNNKERNIGLHLLYSQTLQDLSNGHEKKKTNKQTNLLHHKISEVEICKILSGTSIGYLCDKLGQTYSRDAATQQH